MTFADRKLVERLADQMEVIGRELAAINTTLREVKEQYKTSSSLIVDKLRDVSKSLEGVEQEIALRW